MRNLKYTRKLLGETDTPSELNPDLPENWHDVMDIVNIEKRKTGRNLTWAEAEQLLRRERVPDITKTLLLLKSMKIIETRFPKRGVDY